MSLRVTRNGRWTCHEAFADASYPISATAQGLCTPELEAFLELRFPVLIELGPHVYNGDVYLNKRTTAYCRTPHAVADAVREFYRLLDGPVHMYRVLMETS